MDNINLEEIKSYQSASNFANRAHNIMLNDGMEFNKKYGQQLLDAMYIQFSDPSKSSISKLMTLHILKYLTYQSLLKFFTILSNHKTLQHLYNQAKNIDPFKPLDQKGLKKFSKQPDMGKQYMNLLLQLMVFWGERLVKNKHNEPTKFKKHLLTLQSQRVVLPSLQSFEYFEISQCKKKQKKTSATANPIQSNPTGSLLSEIRFTKNKIDIYLSQLIQADEQKNEQRVSNLISKNHLSFQQSQKQYNIRRNQAQNDQAIQSQYFGLIYFFQKQMEFYNNYIPNNQFKAYIVEIKKVCQQTLNIKIQSQPKRQHQQPNPQYNKPQKSIYPTLTNPQQQRIPQHRYENNNDNNYNHAIINSLYQKLQSRSKSPKIGFKNVGMELEKQRSLSKKGNRRNQSKSPNRSGTGLGISNVSNQSRINPIFDNPPNRYLSPKSYEGQTIEENRQLSGILYNIKKQQGSRRFKISNFRQKNPLFENQHIQVGYKSQAIYENFANFSRFIMLNIFIGNKTEDGIKEFRAEYKADKNQILYASPKNVDSIIPAGYQCKHDLVITPMAVPFSFMSMHISYKFNKSQVYTNIVLPNSVMKYTSYMRIQRGEFENNWQRGRKFKTNPFRLCKHLAPDSFTKWITALSYLTNYSQFSTEGSQTDLEMYCLVIMLQKYQGVIKINIRPNLQVILQLSVLDSNQESLNYFKFYLETLELILKQTEM